MGPKVIPPKETFDTARYGDRPFPVVPVDWFDRKHEAATHGRVASRDMINSPGFDGSTFNLYQEMSYGQLFPNGTVPSAGIASRGWDYAPGFNFSRSRLQGTCTGNTFSDFRNTALYPERIKDGWYQLPGDTAYYGGDKFGTAIPGAVVPGAGLLMDIDSACGPTGKAVYDAAQAADPEIDYSDYDTDKDGVVDFFMMVFAGGGGHGESQTSRPALRQHLAALVDARVVLHRPGDRPEGLHLRRPAEGQPGRLALLRERDSVDDDDHRDGLPRLRARRPVQRQPRDVDRQGERDLARVRPLARPAGLLLDGRAHDVRRLQPDGDRQVPAHGRQREAGARLAGAARARARHDAPSPAGSTRRSTPTGSTGRTRTATRTR